MLIFHTLYDIIQLVCGFVPKKEMCELGKLFSVIFMNLWGFDILIFLAAILNTFIYFMVRSSSDKLYRQMNHRIHVSHFSLSRQQTDKQVSRLRIEDVIEMRDDTDRLYSLFINITGIFPLLGILGTVVSLLGLVQDIENVTGNFYGALTSTFWGLIFAIIFKFLDGMIAPKIENNNKSVQMYLDRIDADAPDAKPEAGDDEDDGLNDILSRRNTYTDNTAEPAYTAENSDLTGITMNDELHRSASEQTYSAPEEPTYSEPPRANEDQLFGGDPEKDLDFGTGTGIPPVQGNDQVIQVRNEDIQIISDENGEDK